MHLNRKQEDPGFLESKLNSLLQSDIQDSKQISDILTKIENNIINHSNDLEK
jgi:hypothetical protein